MSARFQRYVSSTLHRFYLCLVQFRIDTRELEVSGSQAPSLPTKDAVHPLMGQQVVVIKGPQRGYDGYIRAVGNVDITVEIRAMYTSPVSPFQNFGWDQLRLM